MFSGLTDRLRLEVDTIKRVLATHDQVRTLLFEPAETLKVFGEGPAAAVAPLALAAPGLLAWRIYDHCAAFTRLYAVYEQFVEDLVSEWLRQVPVLWERYEELPEAVRRGHRMGISYVLRRLGSDRYGHLPEVVVARGFFEGVTGVVPYELLSEAFLIDEQNLRDDVLNALCARIGIEDAWRRMSRHPNIVRFLRDVRGNASTAESELRNLVYFRNNAAHGAPGEVVATDEIRTIADAVLLLGEALAELMMLEAVRRRLLVGSASQIGVVIRRFRGRVVGVRMRGATISVGDRIVVLRGQSCYSVTVESIQVNHKPFEKLEAGDGEDVGLLLSQEAAERSAIIRLNGEAPAENS